MKPTVRPHWPACKEITVFHWEEVRREIVGNQIVTMHGVKRSRTYRPTLASRKRLYRLCMKAGKLVEINMRGDKAYELVNL